MNRNYQTVGRLGVLDIGNQGLKSFFKEHLIFRLHGGAVFPLVELWPHMPSNDCLGGPSPGYCLYPDHSHMQQTFHSFNILSFSDLSCIS